jgi:heme-degrading monooxygenase HmoA
MNHSFTPYYAVIFTSQKKEDIKGYDETSELMLKLAAEQPGFISVESARNEIGITVSYWESLDAIKNWKENVAHKVAQQKGQQEWYLNYKVRICRVEREYGSEFK